MIAHLHIKVIYGQKGDQIMKKKFLSVILLTLVLAFNSVALSAPTPSPSPTPKATQTDDNKENKKTDFPEIHAESAIVLDTKSGMVIKDIDADKKGLSWKGWKQQYNAEKKNYFATDFPNDVEKIIKGINEKRPEIKFIVIDTAGMRKKGKVYEKKLCIYFFDYFYDICFMFY